MKEVFPTGEQPKTHRKPRLSPPEGFFHTNKKKNNTHKSCISSSPEADVNTSSSPITWFEEKTRTLNVQEIKELEEMCCWLNSTHILMLHVFEQPELPVSPLSKYLGLERPVELLNGHFLFSPLIYCWAVVNNRTPSHYLCTHEPSRFTTISFFRSREKTTWWSVWAVLRFRGGLVPPRTEWRGLWLRECQRVFGSSWCGCLQRSVGHRFVGGKACSAICSLFHQHTLHTLVWSAVDGTGTWRLLSN